MLDVVPKKQAGRCAYCLGSVAAGLGGSLGGVECVRITAVRSGEGAWIPRIGQKVFRRGGISGILRAAVGCSLQAWRELDLSGTLRA